MEEGPTCNKLAGSALIHTCATTVKGDSESTGRLLDVELMLFAARYAICELSESKDRNFIPAECASFVHTGTTTDQGDWSGHNNQDLEQCVAALSKSPQGWMSYSNAKQSAHVWCSVARTDIEKNDLLRKMRQGIEVAGLTSDALRHQAEAIQQQMEKLQSFSSELRKFAQDMSDLSEKSIQILDNHAARLEDISRATQERNDAQLDQHNITLERMTSEARSKLDGILSMAREAVERRNVELAIAQTKNAEEARQQTAYAHELFKQNMLQLFYNASSALDEYNMKVVGISQYVNAQFVALHEKLVSAEEVAQNVTVQLQQNQEQAENVSLTLVDIKSSVTELMASVDCLWTIVGAISGVLKPVVPYCRYIAGAVILLLLKHLLGGPTLSQAMGCVFKTTLNAGFAVLGTSSKLAKRAGVATVSHLPKTASLVKQSMGIKSAISFLLAVIGATTYLVAKGSPSKLFHRLKDFSVSQVEAATMVVPNESPIDLDHLLKDLGVSPFVAAVIFMVVVFVIAFARSYLCEDADNELEDHVSPRRVASGLPFNNPKNYGQRKWVV